jgi:primosomal protein N'
MWTCKQCGEQIEDQFDSCWKCAGQTADSKSGEVGVAAASDKQPEPIQCPRCQIDLEPKGRKRFYEAEWTDLTMHHLHFDIFVCPRCGRTEFFSAGIGEELRPN